MQRHFKTISKTKEDSVWLTQTDTTVGFLSQSAEALINVKQRDASKQFLTALPDLKSLKQEERVPLSLRKELRRAKKRTYIFKERAYRVVSDGKHHDFLKRLGWAYSTSANKSNETYNEEFCFENADIIHISEKKFHESSPSSLYKIVRGKKLKLR